MFVHSGFSPGAPAFLHTFAFPGQLFVYRCEGSTVLDEIIAKLADAKHADTSDVQDYLETSPHWNKALAPLQTIPAPLVCDKEFTALTGTHTIGYTLSMLMLFPALVLVDRFGPRFIAVLGSVLNLFGQIFLPFAMLQAALGMEKMLWPTVYIGFFFIETGARFVGAGAHAFVWHLDGVRRRAFIIIAIMFNLQSLMGLFYQSLMQKAVGMGSHAHVVQGYFSLLLLGTMALLVCTPSRKEYKETAGETLGTPFPDWDYTKSKWQHVKQGYRYARDVLKMSYIRNFFFGFTVVCMTSWVTMYKCMASVYAYDMWGGNIVEDFGSMLPTNFTGAGMDFALFKHGNGKDGVYNDLNVGKNFAVGVIWTISITTIIVWVLGQKFIDTIGMGYMMAIVTAAQYLASSNIYVSQHFNQFLVQVCAGISVAGSYVLIGKHMNIYAPPKAIASVTCLLNFCIALMSCILILFSIEICNFISLPSAFSFMTNLSFLITFIYTVICFWYEEPTTCVLGPGEELKACRLYACKSINEVLYVTGFDTIEIPKPAPGTKKVKGKKAKKQASPWEVMQNMLASSEPAVQTAIVRSIRPDRMEEKLTKLSDQEILDMIKEGLVWETGSKKTFQGTTGGFAITPQLWSQFWRQIQDVSMLKTIHDQASAAGTEAAIKTTTMSVVSTNGHGSGSNGGKSGVTLLTPKEIQWKKDMLRSLNARQHTKELAKILRQGDRAMLQEWLLNANIDNIVSAVWDMTQWDNAVEENAVASGEETFQMHLTDMFDAMFPLDVLANMMLQRPTFKPVVVECMKRDLIKAQTNLERTALGGSSSMTVSINPRSSAIVNSLSGAAK